MNSKEIERNLNEVVINLIPEEFIYDFLLAFGISKTSISRLKKGDFNMSKIPGEILYRGKVFFKTAENDALLYEIDEVSKNERILKQNPRFIIITDFETIVAKDLKSGLNKEFQILELPKHYSFFLPLTGAEIYKSSNDNKADRDASYELAKLYDVLINDNTKLLQGNSHILNLFLSRLLFCFFAEDTGIFKTESIFSDTLANHTKEDGSNVHIFLTDLFYRLNNKKGKFPAYVEEFPYVNGGLFKDEIECPKFTKKSRDILLNCSNLNWDEINPDIFGSMIQAVADPEERSDLGMHYTSVPNIKKLIEPLFLNELKEEFEKNSNSIIGLRKLLFRLGNIKFFDPACGSGNFLIITYKEIRLLEISIIKKLIDLDAEKGQKLLYFTNIKLSQFYGIEIKDFAHEMAMLSLWLSEHQMNKIFETELMDYGKSEPILPLKESGKIVCGNSARMDWNSVCPRSLTDEIYIIGNPPYLGARIQDKVQKEDIEINFKKEKGVNNLDYISIWFYKGAKYIEGYNAQLAFVTTNSICQGEQVSLLWPRILSENLEIGFAHLSFKWSNNAKGNAGVTVNIIGLRNKSSKSKYLFNENIKKEVKNINSYLLDAGDNIYILPRSKPISEFPEMNFGSMPNDGGNLIMDKAEYEQYKNHNQDLAILKKFKGGQEFLNDIDRYCIWLNKDNYENYLDNELIGNRLRNIKTLRTNSDREATKKLAEKFYSFGEIRHRDTDSLIIPATSSERREYIPIGLLTSETVISNSAMAIYDAQPWLFGVLHSKMHMVWVDAVGGKLETRYRYSAKLCYNTFPFPPITEKDKQHISEYVFAVLDERSKFPEKTMAWLYNPDTMPAGLKEAHKELDLAIERIYRLRPFESDAERLEFLFKMYDEMTKRDTLFAKEKKARKKK